MTEVLISLGSNIAPADNLRAAVRLLAARMPVLGASPVYASDPVGTAQGARFMNAALAVRWEGEPAELKRLLLAIEEQLGRQRTADRNAPRTIDLDITLYGDQVLELGARHIPDPELLRYAHIARPAADLWPDWTHPELGQSLKAIADRLGDHGLTRLAELILWPPSSDERTQPCHL